MVHHRVAHEHQFIDRARIDFGLACNGLDQPVQRRPHRRSHLHIAAGIHHRIGHPAHQVFAKADLRVHHPGTGQHRAIGQIAKMRRNGGRTKVDGQPQQLPLMIARPDVENPVACVVIAFVQCNGDFPVALAQGRLQPSHQGQLGGDAIDLPLAAQRPCQPLKITGRFMHVRLVDLDIVKPCRRIHHDVALRRRFANDLFVNLAFGRHVDHHIALHAGLAAKPTPGRQATDAIIAGLDGVPVAQRAGLHGDAVFGKFAITRRNLAFRTDTTSAANRIQIDAKLAGGGQDRRAMREAAAFARGGKDDERVGHEGFPVFLWF